MSHPKDDISAIVDELDEFSDRVYWLVQQVPEGEVATYGQIATLAGSARAARAVGNLMRTSYANGVELPWWRIINASGKISLKGDLHRPALQRELLEKEGIEFRASGRCDLESLRWSPDHDFWILQ